MVDVLLRLDEMQLEDERHAETIKLAHDEIESLRFQLGGVLKHRALLQERADRLSGILAKIYQCANQPMVVTLAKAGLDTND